ncbi:MAG: HDOD domain-containing protein [Alphaproteobacteria bacterium]|uniref:HDOD domain-containing protein n=1 Tax=Candidatus Nitrobium versatile TaxID=2884831 RepID=A0A953M197_9BACT|nr:HDOD domain-containing protein [Candidatus Nitrobium versatile]
MKRLANIPEVITDIPSLPAVASKVLQLITCENSSINDLMDVVSLDHSFASRLIRIANSPYYTRDTRVGDVSDAIIRIGFTTVRALVFAASLRDMGLMSDSTDRVLWEHNTAVALGATVIARETGLLPSGEPLIHGLLHDVGKVLINRTLREKYGEVIRRVQEQKIPFIEAERSLLGFDHNDVGEYVAERWNLPDHLSFVLANHHREDLLTVKDATLRKTVLSVKAADALCSSLGIGMACTFDLSDEEWKYLKLSNPRKRSGICERIEEEFPSHRDFIMGQGN